MPKKVPEKKKTLYDWAEECLFNDDISRFLDYCKKDGYDFSGLLSYSEFKTLKEEFES